MGRKSDQFGIVQETEIWSCWTMLCIWKPEFVSENETSNSQGFLRYRHCTKSEIEHIASVN